jgi:hypothetical protein
MRLTDHEIHSAALGLRLAVQESTTYTVDAMMVCLIAASTFAKDGTDADIAADRFAAAAEVIAASLRRGKEMRLDS